VASRRQWPGLAAITRVETTCPSLDAEALGNKRLALRCGRLGFIVQALLQTACIVLVAGRLAREL